MQQLFNGRYINFFQNCRGDKPCSNLAQCNDRWFVILGIDHRLCAVGDPARALCGDQNHLKNVIDILQAIFNCNACHRLYSSRLR